MIMRVFASILMLLVLAGCAAPNAAAPTVVVQQAAAAPSATLAPSATVVPTATAIQAVIVTAEPTATTTPTPSVTPSPTVIQAVLVAPPAQPAVPAQPASQELRYATIPTDDGYVAVREQPTTASTELARLTPGTVVVCSEIVRGQTLFGSNRWAKCPSVGGYIFAPLLERTSAAPVVLLLI